MRESNGQETEGEEIIGNIPKWIVRVGGTLSFTLIIAFLCCSYFLKYPIIHIIEVKSHEIGRLHDKEFLIAKGVVPVSHGDQLKIGQTATIKFFFEEREILESKGEVVDILILQDHGHQEVKLKIPLSKEEASNELLDVSKPLKLIAHVYGGEKRLFHQFFNPVKI